MKGLFITFEGGDGAGKSTHITRLMTTLTQQGYDVVSTREPGGCLLSERIREMLLDAKNSGMSAATETLLYAAARAQLVQEIIAPALASGKIVLCDRYVDSSLAYQGIARGLGVDVVMAANQLAVANAMPDLTIYLRISPEESQYRRAKRVVKDRLELEGDSFQDKVREAFDALSLRFEKRFVVVDAGQDKDTVAKIIASHVEKYLLKVAE